MIKRENKEESELHAEKQRALEKAAVSNRVVKESLSPREVWIMSSRK